MLCKTCGRQFTPTHRLQRHCPDCRAIRAQLVAIPRRYEDKACESCGAFSRRRAIIGGSAMTASDCAILKHQPSIVSSRRTVGRMSVRSGTVESAVMLWRGQITAPSRL